MNELLGLKQELRKSTLLSWHSLETSQNGKGKVGTVFKTRVFQFSPIVGMCNFIELWTGCALFVYHQHRVLHQDVGVEGFYQRRDDTVPL